MNDYKYLFSVIVPIYNTEKYLEECIESIVNQTIGFANIQLILINDGSTDNSEEICLKYKNKYPDNIVYRKETQNIGVSSCRNSGYNYIEGKYVDFLDADDKFPIDSFEKVYTYFEDNYNDINLVIIPIEFFGDWSGMTLDSKNMGCTRIRNILDDEYILNNGVNNFFKKELLLKYKFDKSSPYGEDFKLINSILLNERKYGSLTNTKYLYRRVEAENSAGMVNFDISRNKEYILNNYIKDLLQYLVNISINIYGEVIKYAQRNILSSIGGLIEYTIDSDANEILFIKDLKEILQFIDDEAILNVHHFRKYQRLFLLQLKYEKFDKDISKIDLNFLIEKNIISIEYKKINGYMDIVLEEVRQVSNGNMEILSIKGTATTPIDNNINKIYLKFKEEYFAAEITNDEPIIVWQREIFKKYKFKINLEYVKCKGRNLEFYIDINDEVEFYSKTVYIN